MTELEEASAKVIFGLLEVTFSTTSGIKIGVLSTSTVRNSAAISA